MYLQGFSFRNDKIVVVTGQVNLSASRVAHN